MFGLFILICVYVMLGFMLAWIAGMVAQEEVSIGTGVLVLILAGVLSVVCNMLVASAAPDIADYTGPVITFAFLVIFLNLIAKLSWKHSAIIGLIYSVVIALVGLGLRSCISAQ
jgi:hypothetical protein